jgi:hypothetical protein
MRSDRRRVSLRRCSPLKYDVNDQSDYCPGDTGLDIVNCRVLASPSRAVADGQSFADALGDCAEWSRQDCRLDSQL